MIRGLTLRNAARMGIVAALTASVWASVGCVSQEEYKRLNAAFQQARAQLAEAESEIARLKAQIADLEAQLAEKQRLLDSGMTGVEALKKERDLLAARLAELQDKYNRLLEITKDNIALPPSVNDALANLAKMYPDLLEYDAERGLIRFKSDLTFDLGSTEVKPRAKEALGKFAGILNMAEIAKNEIRIVGNTDDVPIRRGSPTMTMNPTNWHLSSNRAIAVLDVLRGKQVSEGRIQVAGYGEFRPIAPNAANHRGAEQNRRVDIYILKSTAPDKVESDAIRVTPTRIAAPTTRPASAGVPLPRM